MGKFMVISFDDREENVAEKIYNILEENQFQQIGDNHMLVQITEELSINYRHQTVLIRGQRISFSRYEFLLFAHLAKHPGWIFSKNELYELLWNEPKELCGPAVANVVNQIRRKLRQAGVKKEYIQTVVSSGYCFIKDGEKKI